MTRATLVTILALMILLPVAGATMIQNPQLTVTPVLYTSPSNHCTQLNASFITCPDGSPIVISFSASEGYAPYYGNFTAYPTDYVNESFPIDFYGNICTVASSQTETCFITLSPISPLAGNGTESKDIQIRFVSSIYPQTSFLSSFNMTIAYYDSGDAIPTVGLYDQAYGTYQDMNKTYSYFCTIYQICNQTVYDSLDNISISLDNASALISNSMLDAGFYNLTRANSAIATLQPNYTIYVNSSNRIVNDVIKAKYLISNSSLVYYANEKALQNCTLKNGTNYGDYIQANIANLSAYPVQNTLPGAQGYLNVTAAFSKQEGQLVGECTKTQVLAPKIQLPTVSSNYGIPILAVIIIVIALFAVYRVVQGRREGSMDAMIDQKLMSREPVSEGAPAPEAPSAPQAPSEPGASGPEEPKAEEPKPFVDEPAAMAAPAPAPTPVQDDLPIAETPAPAPVQIQEETVPTESKTQKGKSWKDRLVKQQKAEKPKPEKAKKGKKPVPAPSAPEPEPEPEAQPEEQAPNEPAKGEAAPSEPAPESAEVAPEEPKKDEHFSLEKTFDSWLAEHIGEHKSHLTKEDNEEEDD